MIDSLIVIKVGKEAIYCVREAKNLEGSTVYFKCVCVFSQVGLEGVLLSSCSAAGMWRVRDLAGLGRDDLFSGLRYDLS